MNTETNYDAVKITVGNVTIEVAHTDNLPIAFEYAQKIAGIAQFAAPSVSRSAGSVSVAGSVESALLGLLRAKTGKGFAYRPDGKDAGKTREESLRDACRAAGCAPEEIETATSAGESAGEIVPPIAPDDGGEIF